MNRNTLIALGAAGIGALLGFAWLASGLSSHTRTAGASAVQESTMSNVIHLNAQAFPKLVAQPKPVIIDFWAPWCGPCRTQGPILDQVSLQVGERFIVTKVNVDEERDLAAKFGVQSIPTLVILKEGKVFKQFVGVQQADTLVKALEAAAL